MLIISSEQCRQVCPVILALLSIIWPEPSALLQGSSLEATSSANFNLEELVSFLPCTSAMSMHQSNKLLPGLQWGAYEAWSAYGAEVPLAVPSETADQVCHTATSQEPLLALQTGLLVAA